MKKPTNVQILLYLLLVALAVEVVILARQNSILKAQLQMKGAIRPKVPPIEEGMKVPPIKVKSLDGKDYTIEYEASSKKTLLYFFSLSCPQCMRNIPMWRKLTDVLKDEPLVRIYGVVRGQVESAREYTEGFSLNFPVTVNPVSDSTLGKKYHIRFVPTTLLIDEDGRVVKAFTGVLSDSTQQEILNNIYAKTVL